MAAARKPGEERTQAIESGDPSQVIGLLEKVEKKRLDAILYVDLLSTIDASRVDEATRPLLRDQVFRHLSLSIDENVKTSSRATGNRRNIPLSPSSSPELDIQKVHDVFMLQSLGTELPGIKRRLNPNRVLDLWEFQRDRLFLLPGIIKDVVKKGSPELLEQVMSMARDLPTQQRAALICDVGKDSRTGTALFVAIAKLHVVFVKILIRENTEPHILDKKDEFDDTPLHSVIKDTQTAAYWSPEAQSARQEIIEAIVNTRPSTLWAHDKKNNPPIAYAREYNLVTIENYLRDAIFEKLADVHSIRKALYGPRENYKELCLDMSDFNQKSHDITAFIRLLREYAPKGKYADLCGNVGFFEKKLLYVYLPDLQLLADDIAHDCIRELFRWLKIQDVRSIMDLSIPDNPNMPMSEDFVVEHILKHFIIAKLDWRKLDIDLSVLRGVGHDNLGPLNVLSSLSGDCHQITEHLTSLKLYSSGNYGVLHHWASSDGLCCFQKLKRVVIEIPEPQAAHPAFQHRQEINKAKFKESLAATYRVAQRESPTVDFIVTSAWNRASVHELDYETTRLNNLKILGSFELSHSYLHQLMKKNAVHEPDDVFGQDEADMLDALPVRVAVIDNGVDKVRTNLFKNIENGVSFVKTASGDRVLPWWTVADPHGTQMASLIQSVNPFCRLYIARVGKRRNDIDGDLAAERGTLLINSFSQIRLSGGPSTKACTSSQSAGSSNETPRD